MTTPRTQKRERTKQKTHLLAHAKMLEVKIAEIQAKLIGVQDEIADTQARNYHLFTLLFSQHKPVLLEVWGAEDADAAFHIAYDVARDVGPCKVFAGDQSGGKAQLVYLLCSQRAVEVHLKAIQQHLEGPLLHIVLCSETRSEEAKG